MVPSLGEFLLGGGQLRISRLFPDGHERNPSPITPPPPDKSEKDIGLRTQPENKILREPKLRLFCPLLCVITSKNVQALKRFAPKFSQLRWGLAGGRLRGMAEKEKCPPDTVPSPSEQRIDH